VDNKSQHCCCFQWSPPLPSSLILYICPLQIPPPIACTRPTFFEFFLKLAHRSQVSISYPFFFQFFFQKSDLRQHSCRYAIVPTCDATVGNFFFLKTVKNLPGLVVRGLVACGSSGLKAPSPPRARSAVGYRRPRGNLRSANKGSKYYSRRGKGHEGEFWMSQKQSGDLSGTGES